MRTFLVTCLAFVLLLWPVTGLAVPAADPIADEASSLLDRMTPEERIGQLFLVTFRGRAPRPEDPIFTLIREHHISGVMLQARSDNFADAPDTVSTAYALNTAIQTSEFESSREPGVLDQATGASRLPVYVPLFIGVRQEGDGPPFSEIASGLTTQPSVMALGATWNPDLARKAGEVSARELSALGFNLILGPSLDVVADPRLGGPTELGVRSFGGDPFWVSAMGKAYVEGLHQGSGGRLAVVAKHFPGYGGSDRRLEEEVATVRKSLDELKRIELAPFFAVTSAVPGSDPSVTDAVLTSHIKYAGFQGNIRAQTRPISLDPQAFAQLMALEPLSTWRAGGGVTVSDSLGSRAVRRFYDPREESFKGHLVARDALLAGNDLLFLSDFRSTDDADELTTILGTLSFFTQKYREDSVFAQRVDEAVLRILQLKLRLYGGTFGFDNVIPAQSELDSIGAGREVTLEVARSAATLLSPSQGEIQDRLGGPPQLGQRIVFFTDSRMTQQCSTCQPTPDIAVDALEQTILSLYGPRGAGQVGGWNLTSYRTADLAAYLAEPAVGSLGVPLASTDQVGEAVQSADWLVFLVRSSSSPVYGADALKLLLDRRPDLAQTKRLVVFGLDAPYDLDATDISKIDVYYELYAKTAAFTDVAARLLFQEISASAASPVTVPGIGYDIIQATGPDPDQVISLRVRAAGVGEAPEATAPAGPEEGFVVGDVVVVESGGIVDTNGHLVPDGTPVEFVLSYQAESLPVVLSAETASGIAETTVTLDSLGMLSISSRSDPARVSQVVQLNVQEGVPAFPTVIAPTSEPTPTVQPSPTALSATPTIGVAPASSTQGQASGLGAADFILGMLAVGWIAWAGGQMSSAKGRSVRKGAIPRLALYAAAGGLIGYNYFALALPGSQVLVGWLGVVATPLAAAVGGGISMIAADAWETRRRPTQGDLLTQGGQESDDQQPGDDSGQNSVGQGGEQQSGG
ncbi:MAG TPA: glycoside hydrolase family 3 N-terminal domain-containing protein [Anaerolineales bacterium]|nr:glycoside hydrolase family 3 N-terminal domain-containing protein [Anaerolineales bacterium]